MIYFTADTHFGHFKIINHAGRNFTTAEEMDEALIKNWNSIVKKRDTVYFLGDFSFTTAEKTKSIYSMLNGNKKYFIAGNHDKEKFISRTTGFEILQPITRISLSQKNFVLCHYPILSWPGKGKGALHLHGHSHGKLNHREYNLRHIMDVGMDARGLKPVSLDEILEELLHGHDARTNQ